MKKDYSQSQSRTDGHNQDYNDFVPLFKVIIVSRAHCNKLKMLNRTLGIRRPYLTGAYPGGRPPGGPSEPLILAPWSKVKECRPHSLPPRQFVVPLKFLPWNPACPWMAGADPELFIRGGAQIQD